MKVLMICEGLVPGGKERQLIEVVKNLDKKQFTIGIITFNFKQHYTEQAKQHSNYFRELPKRPTRLEPLFSIWKCFREFKPDIVHTWDSLSSFYSYLPCKILGIPLIDGSIRDAGTDKGRLYYFKKFFLHSADLVIGNSIAGIDAYKTKGTVVYNSIDTSRFLEHSDTSEFNMVMTANFTDYKDQNTFIKAAIHLLQNKIVNNVFLLGDGPYKEKYINLIETNHPNLKSSFHFEGAVKNVESYLTNCHIGVLCSTPKYSEGLSNSVLEYMAAGLVPIVTNLGGSAEIISDGKNGYLIQPGDDQKIIELVGMLKNNQNLREQIILQAKATIEDKFSMKTNLKILGNLYFELLKLSKKSINTGISES